MKTHHSRRLIVAMFLLLWVLVFVSPMHNQFVQGMVGSGWTKYANNPILVAGPGAAWDSKGVGFPSVIKDGSTFKMWYTGFDGTNSRIGYATSSNGISWTKYSSNPVLAGAPFQFQRPTVIKEDAATCALTPQICYKMWYTSFPAQGNPTIDFAISSDGISWIRRGTVLSSGTVTGDPDSNGVLYPDVIKQGSGYIMWYTGYDASDNVRIAMAYSGDGFRWTKYNGNLDALTDVVLGPETSGSWDDAYVLLPTVLKSGDVYFMWYAGQHFSGSATIATGLAGSYDGKTWVKLATTGPVINPVLSPTPSAWDSLEAISTSVIQDRLDFKMWYTGASQSGNTVLLSIGYATDFMRVSGAMGLIDAPANSVYYIYPDYQGTKPTGTSHASLSDWLAMGMLLGMSTNAQYITTDTHTSIVGSNGGPVIGTSFSIILGGGPAVNGPVHYYERVANLSPAYFQNDGGICRFYSRSTGQPIAGTDMNCGQVGQGQDMFIVMAFKDAAGRHVLVLYGYGWQGTYAATLTFKYNLLAGRAGIPIWFDDAYYVYKWTDANGDNFVDLNEISALPVAYGN